MKKSHNIVAILLAVIMMFIMGISVLATDDSQALLTIKFSVQMNGVDTPIKGATVAVCKVADVDVKTGSYHVLDDYSNLRKTDGERDMTFDDKATSDLTKLAEEFYNIKKNDTAINVTNDVGVCDFSDLDNAIYLVYEVSAEDAAKDYEFFAPYFVSVPFSDGDRWNYHVLSEPKTKAKETELPTEIVTIEETTTLPEVTTEVETVKPNDFSIEKIKTGDTMYWLPLMGIMIFSIIVFVFALHKTEGVDTDE